MKKSLQEMSLEELWQLFPIIVEEHKPTYKEWYEEEKVNIMEVAKSFPTRRINHIGSTSIEGLMAKPIVDILLEVSNECDLQSLKDAIVEAGWICMSEEKEPEMKMCFNKGYTLEGFAEKVFHLHIRYGGDWNELYFRDYLLNHTEVAKAYGDLKVGLMERYKHNRDQYTEAKTPFIMEHTIKAREEIGPKYQSTH